MTHGNGASERPFGFWTATALVVGSMIGAGVFVLPAQLATFGTTGAVGWAIAIAGTLVLTWVVTGLSAARPQSSGLIAITGDALGPLVGVVNGWGYWITVWASNAVISLSAATYLADIVPPLGLTPTTNVLTAIAVIWLITLVNLSGSRAVGAVQVATTLLKLLPLIAVLAILAGMVLGGASALGQVGHATLKPSALPSVVNIVFFAMLGFESAGIAAERVRDPARTIQRASMTGVAVTGALYLFACSGIVFALPEKALATSTAPFALFVSTFWGDGAGLAIAAFAVIAAVGCLNGWVLIQGEVPLGMARSGLLPAWIGRTDRRDVPRGLVLASSGLASLLLLLSVSKTTVELFDFILRLTATTALFTYALFCVAALRMGVRRMAALTGLAFSVWAIAGAGLESAGLSLLLMLTALPLYWLRARWPAATSAASS